MNIYDVIETRSIIITIIEISPKLAELDYYSNYNQL